MGVEKYEARERGLTRVLAQRVDATSLPPTGQLVPTTDPSIKNESMSSRNDEKATHQRRIGVRMAGMTKELVWLNRAKQR